MADKKRAEPDPIEPIVLDGIRYEAPHVSPADDNVPDGGVVVAIQQATGRLLWHAVIYDQPAYDPDMESDKQDVFITSMQASDDGTMLYIVNELGKEYRLDLKTQKVTKVWIRWK